MTQNRPIQTLAELDAEYARARLAEQEVQRFQALQQVQRFGDGVANIISQFLDFLFGAFSDERQAPNYDDVWGVEINAGQLRARQETERAIEEAQRSNPASSTTRLGRLIVSSGALQEWAKTIRSDAPSVIHTSPVAEDAQVTSPFGRRTLHGDTHMHNGLDFGARGTNPNPDIIASAEGVVIFSGWKQGYGNTVILGHADGTYTLYGHLKTIDKDVKLGNQLPRGEVLGQMGNTGRSFGVHLHYEQRVGTQPRDPQIATAVGQNPRTFSKGEPLQAVSDMAILRAVDEARNQFAAAASSNAGMPTSSPSSHGRGRA